MIASFLWMSSLWDNQVVDKLQSGGKSKREGWRTELPSTGLGAGVIDRMKDDKRNDVSWQGKCSGTVYVYNCQLWINIKHLPILSSTSQF